MARQVTPQSFEQHIASGRLNPVYVLTGPDGAMKAKLVAKLVETIEEDLRPFNVDKLFPPDQREEARKQFWTVLQLARTLPMMAPRRVIVVAQAEKLMRVFKAGDDEAPGPAEEARAGRKGRKALQKAAGEAELEAFEEFLSNPTPDAVVVFVAGEGLNRSLKPVKLLEKLATLVDCDPLPEARDAIAWVKAEAAGEGVRVEDAAARLLATLAGGDITRLRAEFERAVLFASGDGIITEAAVREIRERGDDAEPVGHDERHRAGLDGRGPSRAGDEDRRRGVPAHDPRAGPVVCREQAGAEARAGGGGRALPDGSRLEDLGRRPESPPRAARR